MKKKIVIIHNIMWSRYKGEVFSELYPMLKNEYNAEIYQISETERIRSGYGDVDYTCHRYPYNLISKGNYEDLSILKIISVYITAISARDNVMVVLPGYSKLEHWIMLILAKIYGKKIGVFCDSTSYDNEKKLVKEIFKKIFFKSVSAVFAYGKRSKEYVVSYGVDPIRVFEPCHAAENSTIVEPELNICITSNKNFLYVGRISAEKNIETLMRAWAHAIDNDIYFGNLNIAGGGKQLQKLKDLSEKLNIQNSIIFHGSLDKKQLSELYSKNDFIVLPSLSEPWGLVINEGLMHGCIPLVSNRCGCVPELVEAHKYGIVFDPVNEDDLVYALSQAKNLQPDEILEGRAISKCIVSKYSTKEAARNILMGIDYVMGKQK